MIGAVAAAAIAVQQRQVAIQQRQAAIAQRDQAQRNESRALEALANSEAEGGAPATAVRLALTALPMRLNSPDRAYARVAEGALLYSVQHLRERRRFRHENSASSVAFSPDGRTLATCSWDNTARLWTVGQGLIDLACARVHELSLSDKDKQRFGIENEWCTPEVSAELRARLGLDKPEESVAAGTAAR